jgi:hypothetical protein
MSTEDDLLYAAEDLAFQGTPLADQFDRSTLIAEVKEIARHPAVSPLVGMVAVSEATVRLVSSVAYAEGQTIKFAPNRMQRYVAVHELAHVVKRRSGLAGSSHGPEYRAMYADLTAIAYGQAYGVLLRQAFHEMGLSVHSATLPLPISPVIDIDLLADQSGGSRWL